MTFRPILLNFLINEENFFFLFDQSIESRKRGGECGKKERKGGKGSLEREKKGGKIQRKGETGERKNEKGAGKEKRGREK
jgi:hypothetical protein